MGSGPTATCKEVVKRFTKREPTKKQRIIARIVMVVFMTMLTMSVLLVIVSLTMSEHIDDLARKITTNKIRIGISKDPATNNLTSFKQTYGRDSKPFTDSTLYTEVVTEVIVNTTEASLEITAQQKTREDRNCHCQPKINNVDELEILPVFVEE